MLKIAIAASILLACLAVPTVQADEAKKSIGDLSGFGTASMPSEATKTQSEELSIPGDEPLSEPGKSAPTGNQSSGNRNLLNLPPVSSGMPFKGSYIAPANLSLQREGLTELQPARFATLSDKDPITGELLPARYAELSKQTSAPFVAPPISKIAAPVGSILKLIKGTDGF